MPTINFISEERERERDEDKCEKCQVKSWEFEITETQGPQEQIMQLCAECQELYDEQWKCQDCGECCREKCNTWHKGEVVVILCEACSLQRVLRNQQTTNATIQRLEKQLHCNQKCCWGSCLITALLVTSLVSWVIYQHKEKLKHNRKPD